MSVSAEAVRSFLLERLADRIAALGLDANEIGPDFDLYTKGVIDRVAAIKKQYSFNLSLWRFRKCCCV